MLYRLILPDWAKKEDPGRPKVLEGEFTDAEISNYNADSYNVYFLPNYPSSYTPGTTAVGSSVDVFRLVFVDMDLKDGVHTKDSFITLLKTSELLPTFIIDSGNGIHAYWQVSDLDAMSYLRIQRRLTRLFKTDEAVGKIFQLMRAPGTVNNKHKGSPKLCEEIYTTQNVYTCEQLSQWLPTITQQDEEYCKRHYDQTYKVMSGEIKITDELPHKFLKLLRDSKEINQLYLKHNDDRSSADYRLAHVLFAEGFTKTEALQVLVNCKKASERSPAHRYSYALNIADKVWAYEENEDKNNAPLSKSVKDILKKGSASLGERLPCWRVFDATDHGFRLTQVLGLIGGAGSGKTTLALNYFYHFTKRNPNYIHLFVSLEQPEEEIANRWARIAAENENLHDKVHVLSNYNQDGSYRNLSLSEIEDYVIELENKLSIKIGCVVIDHIGVLKKVSREGENQGLIDICHGMKAFAKRTNTFLVMQSQTSREKAGIGDMELDKDAAYGTSMFEWYCDYIVTTWQPLKRIYARNPKMTCTAFKYCKIRHKNVLKDEIKEDVIHVLMYDPTTELLREMTQQDDQVYDHLNKQVSQLRNRDRKKEPNAISLTVGRQREENAKVNSNKNQ